MFFRCCVSVFSEIKIGRTFLKKQGDKKGGEPTGLSKERWSVSCHREAQEINATV